VDQNFRFDGDRPAASRRMAERFFGRASDYSPKPLYGPELLGASGGLAGKTAQSDGPPIQKSDDSGDNDREKREHSIVFVRSLRTTCSKISRGIPKFQRRPKTWFHATVFEPFEQLDRFEAPVNVLHLAIRDCTSRFTSPDGVISTGRCSSRIEG